MLISRDYTTEDTAKAFGISLEESKQVHKDITKMIFDVRMTVEEYKKRKEEIDLFYKVT